MGTGHGHLLDGIRPRLQPRNENLAGTVCGVAAHEGGILIDLEGGVGQRLHALAVILGDAKAGHGLVGDDQPGIVGGGGVVGVNVNAVGLVVEGVALRGYGLFNFKITHLDIVDIGQSRLVGGHGGDKLAVPVHLKTGTGQVVVGVGVLLGEDQGELAAVREGHGHIPLAVPVYGLGLAVQVVALRGCLLIHLVAAQGELVGVELDIASVVGDLGDLEVPVDLLKAEGRSPQGVIGLNVLLVDGEGAEGVILDGLKGGVRRNDLHVSWLNHSISRRSLGLHQGEDFLGVQIVPEDLAIGIGGAGEVRTAGAG